MIYQVGNDIKCNNEKYPPKRCNAKEGRTSPGTCTSQWDYTMIPAERTRV